MSQLLLSPNVGHHMTKVLFVKWWAIASRIPEMEKTYQKYQNGKVWGPGIKEWDSMTHS